jgi:hypothetical protein
MCLEQGGKPEEGYVEQKHHYGKCDDEVALSLYIPEYLQAGI